jgi:hypothetical protein
MRRMNAVGATKRFARSPGTFLVLLRLGIHCGWDNNATIKEETLAQELGMSVRAVRGHLDVLDNEGLIDRWQNRRHRPYHYRLTLDEWLLDDDWDDDDWKDRPAKSAARGPAKYDTGPANPAGLDRQSTTPRPAKSAGPQDEASLETSLSETSLEASHYETTPASQTPGVIEHPKRTPISEDEVRTYLRAKRGDTHGE